MDTLRRLVALSALIVMVLCVCGAVQATTITFDEFPDGTAIGPDTYGYLGVHFSPGANDPNGTIYAAGTWNLTGPSGPQFSGWSTVNSAGMTTASSGLQITFDFPVSEFSIDFATGTGSTVITTLDLDWFAYDGNVLAGFGSIEFPPEADAGEDIWITLDITADLFFSFDTLAISYRSSTTSPNIGFDNMKFTPDVPVPGTVLLLGSGLVPFLLRRRK